MRKHRLFNWLTGKGKKPSHQPVTEGLRETLFGDCSLADWASHSESGEPWLFFTRAKQISDSGDHQGAVAILKQIVAMPNLESRHYLQAWHFLRQYGEQPPLSVAKNVLGLVVEVSMPQGLDLLAAYGDYSARYYNFSGAGVVWEGPTIP